MREISLMYEIVGSHRYNIDIDDYEDEILERYGKDWDELTQDEKNEFVAELGDMWYEEAQQDCEYGLNEFEGYEEGDETIFFD